MTNPIGGQEILTSFDGANLVQHDGENKEDPLASKALISTDPIPINLENNVLSDITKKIIAPVRFMEQEGYQNEIADKMKPIGEETQNLMCQMILI